MRDVLPDGRAFLAGQNKRMKNLRPHKIKNNAQGIQLKGTLVFPQRGTTAGFRLRSSGLRPETMLASASIPPFSLYTLTLIFLFYKDSNVFLEGKDYVQD